MKKVIYTAILGGYEQLKETIYPNQGWKHICFSDIIPEGPYKGWNVVRVNGINPRLLAHRVVVNENGTNFI